MFFSALLLSLSLHHGKPLANVVRCTPTQCVKIPVWKARHVEYGHWTKHSVRFIHGKWRRVTLTFPILHASARSYTVPMLVTWYDDTGVMADGVMTYPGAAACGWDLPTGAKVHVQGVPGVLTCHDRIGFDPFHHVDVWLPNSYAASLLGLGMDYRMVRVFI